MTVFSVTNSAQLQSALVAARGGDTISLRSGNYGDVNIVGRNYASAVTITSASGADAHFDTLFLKNSSLLTFRGIDMGRGLKPLEPEYTKLVTISNASNIKMDAISIHGSLDNNSANDGIALLVDKVSGFEINNSHIEQAFRGILLQQSSNVKIAGTTFDEMRSDGINVAAVVGVTLDNNYFMNFRPVGSDHADAIQFWNVGQPSGSRDIVITNNVVMNGTGIGPQGIFMNANSGWAYSNVVIKNNLIYGNDAYHGIYVDGGQNVQIAENSTLSRQGDTPFMWIQVTNSNGVDIRDNLTERLIIAGGVTGLTQSNNKTFLTDPALKLLLPNLDHPSSVQDLIVQGIGYHAGESAPAGGTTQVSAIFGTAAPWETVRGTAANETIQGVAKVGDMGTGTRDTLYGGGGNDIFVLGDARGIFYDDKSPVSGGWGDHALIMDFDKGDKIQLVGKLADYVTRIDVINGVTGTSILRDDNHNGRYDANDEYIAHVSGSTAALALKADDYLFVPPASVSTKIEAAPSAAAMDMVHASSILPTVAAASIAWHFEPFVALP